MSKVPPIRVEKLAESYDEKRRMDPADFERLLGAMLRYGEVGGRVLEVGCGTGFFLVPLAQRLPETHFYGIEPNDAMLVQARGKTKTMGIANCLLARADAHSLPFPERAFDFVLMSQVIHFFSDKAMAAAEVRRVTSKEARLLVITTSHPQLKAQVDLSFFPGAVKRDIARIPSIAEIRHIFEEQGFELYNTLEFATTFKASSANDLAEWVTRRPWSSYLLFSEKEFARRIKGFRRKLKNTFGRGEIAYLVPQTLLFFRKA